MGPAIFLGQDLVLLRTFFGHFRIRQPNPLFMRVEMSRPAACRNALEPSPTRSKEAA